MFKKYSDLAKNRNYIKSLSAALINRFGDSIDAIASSWIVYELTGEAAWSAIIFAINRIPTIFITPLVGPWVENHRKKHIMAVTDLIRAVCVGIIATGLLLGFLNAPLIAVLNLVISTAEAFRTPAGTAILPQIIPEELYSQAISLNQSLSSVTELVGTASAGIIIAVIGSSGAIYIDMVTFVLSAILILSMSVKENAGNHSASLSPSSYMQQLKEGFDYCRSKDILVSFSLVILFLNGILVPLNSLQAPLVAEVFKGNPYYLSAFGITITVSMLVGSVIYPSINKRINVKIALVTIALGIAFFYIGVVAASPLYGNRFFALTVLVALTSVLGLSVSIGNMTISVEMLKVIDKSYLARASAIGSALGCAIMPVSAFIVSIAVRFVSVRTIFIVSGIISIAFCSYLFWRYYESLQQQNSDYIGEHLAS